MDNGVKSGFGDLVMSLEPEGPACRFALATAPASIGQGQTFLVASHALKIACLEGIPRLDD